MKKNILLIIIIIVLGKPDFASGQWTTYQTNNTNTFFDYITDIATEGNYVWCATSGGVVRWNKLDGSHIIFSNFIHTDIYSAAIDWNKQKWFGAGFSILAYNDTTWAQVKEVNGVVNSIAVDSVNKRIIFCITAYYSYSQNSISLLSYDGEKWNVLIDNILGNFFFPSFKKIVIDTVNPWNIWCNGDKKSLYYFVKTDKGYVGSIPEVGNASSIAIDKDGYIWMSDVSSSDIRLFSRYTNSATIFSADVTGAISKTRAMVIDRNNVKWFGTDSTLVRYDNVTWNSYPFPKLDGPNTLTVDEDGDVWIGRGDGLLRFHPPVITSINENTSLPQSLKITGNYPNPFNPSTTIEFSIQNSGSASLSIYSLTGQLVRKLISGPQSAGSHFVLWDGRDDSGKPVSSGVYISRLQMGDKVAVGRMLLLK